MSRCCPSTPSDQVALRFGPPGDTVELTYRELAGAAGRARAAASPGARRVAVHADADVHTAVGVVAGLLAGVPVVPLNPKLGERELAHVLADAAPERVLAAPGAELPFDLPRDRHRHRPRPGRRRAASRPARPAGDPALVIYTSGTTGLPKGAVLSRPARRGQPRRARRGVGVDGRRPARPRPPALPRARAGARRARPAAPRRHRCTTWARSTRPRSRPPAPTLVFGVPTQYHRLADQLEGDPAAAAAIGRARLLVSGSAALTAVDHARLRKLTGLAVRERYGLTETLILTAARADDEPEPGTVGPPAGRHGAPAGPVGRRRSGEPTTGRHRGPQPQPVRRLPQPARRHRRRAHRRRLVRHRGHRPLDGVGRARDRRPQRHRPDQVRRLQDRRGGDRERAAGTRGCRGGGRGRGARRRPRRADRRPRRPGRGSARRAGADRPRRGAARPAQAPAADPVRRRVAPQRHGQGRQRRGCQPDE